MNLFNKLSYLLEEISVEVSTPKTPKLLNNRLASIMVGSASSKNFVSSKNYNGWKFLSGKYDKTKNICYYIKSLSYSTKDSNGFNQFVIYVEFTLKELTGTVGLYYYKGGKNLDIGFKPIQVNSINELYNAILKFKDVSVTELSDKFNKSKYAI